MKTYKVAIIVGLAAVLAALFASTAFGYMGSYGPVGTGTTTYGGMMGGYRGGMMGGYGGYYTNPQAPIQQGATTPATPYQAVFPYQFGGGCMGRFGFNNGYTTTPYAYSTANGASLNITTASTIAQNYVASTGNPDLVVKQVEEYANNFYVQVGEKSTGNGAFELLVNKYTGVVYPEMGPNMMWNTQYGMMRGGILGGIFGVATNAAPMSITPAQATANAQAYLNTALPGTTTGDVTAFHGYYTIEVLNANGATHGMLSVNGYTGQVWLHTWHGTFVQELQVS